MSLVICAICKRKIVVKDGLTEVDTFGECLECFEKRVPPWESDQVKD